MVKPAAGSGIQVIQRMAAILDAMASHDGPVSLKTLAASTSLHASTAHRILNSLIRIGFVERTGAGHYQLGVGLLQLGNRVQAHVDLRRDALPVMEALRDLVGETVNLTVREGDEVVYIERVSGMRNMRVEHVIGGRVPLHVTAVGKMFLAEEGEDACGRYTRRTGLPSYTPKSLKSLPALVDAVATAHRVGFAHDREEAEEGVACIGVPVRDAKGRMVAALSISSPAERLQDGWVEPLRAAGLRLSERLGYFAPRRPAGTFTFS